jgi:hypothetical protein
MKIVTYYNNKYKPIADITLPVMKAYAKKWDMQLSVRNYESKNRFPTWEKLPLVLNHLTYYNCPVLWLDIDTIILDMEFDANKMLLTDKDLTLANNGAGAFAVKPSGKDIISAWLTLGQIKDGVSLSPSALGTTHGPQYDQKTLWHIMQNYPKVNNRIASMRLSQLDFPDDMNYVQVITKPFLKAAFANRGVYRAIEFLTAK